ncbi:hypothetical protein L195_g026857 [Trifolium pratense]|uniref:Uncharacterized protein n=1 Tax=Trifolium pratense TaxID=57577 RepID=A0A2K3NKH0_TRIPR|nr:hypothetical protein L195_g026857 [Trifolium pratense]
MGLGIVLICHWVVWSILKSRNDSIFSDKSMSVEQFVDMIKFSLRKSFECLRWDESVGACLTDEVLRAKLPSVKRLSVRAWYMLTEGRMFLDDTIAINVATNVFSRV